nr:RNA exonuclease 1 homolog [Nothobranchius furzeri]
MFPSSGLFAHVNCPFAQHGPCERPHCFYKHATESWKAFGDKSSVVDLTGDQFDPPAANSGSAKETPDHCLHELEKLNKEIETVKHEVEQERLRLSCYQIAQSDSRNDASKSKYESSSSRRLDRQAYERARKYVVDGSKPKTDLEYDPLSNFSAALHSYSSSGKEHKVKRKPAHSGQKKPSAAQMYQSPSPELLDDSKEDCVLIIDVPLSPDASCKAQKSDTASENDGDLNEMTSVILHSPQIPQNKKMVNVAASLSLKENEICSSCAVPNNQKVQICDGECKNEVILSKCLEDLESFQPAETAENISEAATFPGKDHSLNKCDPSSHADEMNPPQPKDNSLRYKPLAAKAPVLYYTPEHGLTEQLAQDKVQIHCLPVQSMPSVMQGSQQISNKLLEKSHEQAAGNPNQVEADQNTSQSQNVPSVKPQINIELPEQFQKAENEMVLMINSSPDENGEMEELDYSEMELSDSDPMEECYRIFMEAKNGDESHPDGSVEAETFVEKQTVKSPLQVLPGKKRVAHEAKNLEQPLAKSRPQPQVLVPLRGPSASEYGSRPSITSNIQQVQQRASMLTASVKAGQAFISAASQKKPEMQSAPSVSSSESLPAVHNAYFNYIPLGSAVIEVGNNLHLILPQGGFPLASTSSPVTSVLTPVSQVHPSPVPLDPSTVNTLLRYRPAAPVLIAAPPRRPAVPTTSQPAIQAAPKPKSVKRKLKHHPEAVKDKVPHDVRQRYVNMFTEEFLKTTPNVHDAFEKALAEEKSVYSRSVNKLKYLSVAVNALKRLKNQSSATKHEEKVQNQRQKGNIPFNGKKQTKSDMTLYEILKDYVLTDERMTENNYPVQHPEKPGAAVLFVDKKANADPLKRICCRCGATYSVSQTGKHVRKEECNYHYGKGVENKVPGGVETRYSCCQGIMGAPGCQVFKLHVHDSLSLDGFVSTVPRCPSDLSCPGVYSLDCEMCYTVQGLELSRVTVVNSDLQVIYDTFVRPNNDVIDYNTRFSGISEEDLKRNHASLREIQQTLLSFVSADTILVGHGLETDLCLLKLLHGMVVDTSVVFPHRLGPPNKLSLNSLTAEFLRRIIQESVCGHDTADDAAACMELMLWKVKEDGKLKK